MQKISSVLQRIKSWSLRRKIFYIVLILIVAFIVFLIIRPKDNSKNISTDVAKIVDLKQTILATGQVTSNTDLTLSFYNSGIVRTVKVKVGDKVKSGQILATLDQGNELASLTQAKGALAAANAKYQSIIDGASSEEINLAKVALQNAKDDYDRVKSQQAVLVGNAYKAMMSNDLTASPDNTSLTNITAPSISGTYEGEAQGDYVINIPDSSSFITSGMEVSTGTISTTTPTKLGTKGLFIQFPSGFNTSSNTKWIVSIPNKKSSTYTTYYNAYQAALKTQDSALGTAQALVDQREAELAVKQASARQSDIDLAKANILTAEGQFESASANFEHTILRAPADGTITRVDIKIGELAQAQKDVMALQDVNNIYLEANVNEANITGVMLGAPVDVTFDAFGTDQIYKATVGKIDPASTLVSGVVNYKVTAYMDSKPELRPGMTANMTILAGEKNNALVIPARAIIKDQSGNKTVRLIIDPKTKTYKEVSVTTGLEGDSGMTEITSGLKEGDEVVTLIKK